MKALLLAAGFGTRLRPLTDTMPKCMVPINGRPLLDLWLQTLLAAGIDEVMVNTHYKAEQVTAFLESSAYCPYVTVAHEQALLGTAATLISHLDFFGNDDGMLIHADNYCRDDLRTFIHRHEQRPAGCLMSMMTFRTGNPSSCGIVTLDRDNVMTGFEEKQARPKGNLANGAIYILSADLLARLRLAGPDVTDFSTQVLPTLLGRVYVYETAEVLIDIGTPSAYAAANDLAMRPGGL